MSNGKIIAEIRQLVEEGGKLSPVVRDRLILSAILELYDKLEEVTALKKEINWMKPWVQGLRWGMLIIGTASIGIAIGMLTHTFTWPF